MQNELILKGIDATLKALDVDADDLGDSILQPGKLDAFVRVMQRRTNVLQRARFIPMDSQQEDIDRIGFSGRVITEALKPDGTKKGTETAVDPDPNTNKLQAVELRGVMGHTDRTLRRNIERQGLAQTMRDLFAEAAGRDMEEFALLAREDEITDPAHLGAADGWAELAGNKIMGVDTTATGDDGWPVNLFAALILNLPKQYLVDRSDWVIFCPWSIEQDYRDYLQARDTALGDANMTDGGNLIYQGFEIQATAMLERSGDYGVNGHMGDVAMLQNPDNMAWGVFHEMALEPDRNVSERRTDVYLTMEGDAGYEDEDAAVVAYIDAST